MRAFLVIAVVAFFSLSAPAQTSPAVPSSSITRPQPGQTRVAREWTAKDRWNYYLEENFASPGAFFRAAGPALGAQMSDTPPEWGQGMDAYGKRLADQFAVRTIEGTIRHGAAAALDIDPKYRPCDCTGFFPRFGYALLSNVITYKTGGSRTFNAPNAAAVYGSSFSALAWYPSRYSYKDAFREGSQSFVFAGSFNLFREFWPEIRRVVPFARRDRK